MSVSFNLIEYTKSLLDVQLFWSIICRVHFLSGMLTKQNPITPTEAAVEAIPDGTDEVTAVGSDKTY